MKRLGIVLTALLLCCAPAVAQVLTIAPAGVTVYASATATTSDVLIEFTVNDKLLAKSGAQSYLQAARSLSAITKAAGPNATVRDNGSKATMDGTAPTESATVSVAPADLQSVAGRLAAARFTIDALAVVPRDADALDAKALADATHAARSKAETIAVADGRHLGRLLNVAPSFGAMFKDMASSIIPAGPMAQMFAQLQGSAQTASTTEGGSFTFELLP
ncbi:MAG TPA: SIMPL domain-containing protein [Verrucomicrobiae bacterium]|jgi:hypothetical protein|nr:SIMPL domain-containing protein [Verrucomicrobiae bacterium]